MKKKLTTLPRVVVYMIGAAIVAVCGVLLPEIAREEAMSNPNVGPAIPFFIGAWILSTPLFIGLYHMLQFLSYIDRDMAFSDESVTALRNIKKCAIAFGILIVISVVIIITVVQRIDPTEDMPPVPLFGSIVVFISMVIATFAGVLQKLLQNAVDMKSENDLTV